MAASLIKAIMNRMESLHEAVLQGDVKEIKALLKGDPHLAFSKDDSGDTPLHLSASQPCKQAAKMAKLFLAKQAEVSARGYGGWTPLHAAAFWGNRDVAELLLAKHAEVNSRNDDGNAPLHEAAIMDRVDIAKLLLASRAEVNAKNNEGETPLHTAARSDSKQAAELLLANRADVNAKDKRGRTPLHRAAEAGWGHKGMAELLLAQAPRSTPMITVVSRLCTCGVQWQQ